MAGVVGCSWYVRRLLDVSLPPVRTVRPIAAHPPPQRRGATSVRTPCLRPARGGLRLGSPSPKTRTRSVISRPRISRAGRKQGRSLGPRSSPEDVIFLLVRSSISISLDFLHVSYYFCQRFCSLVCPRFFVGTAVVQRWFPYGAKCPNRDGYEAAKYRPRSFRD